MKLKYIAKHPRNLVQYVKNKRNSWEKRLKQTREYLPELISLYKIAEKPIVRYQQGAAGLKAIYNETLESKTEILSILDIEGWDRPEFRQFGKDYNKERSKRKIKERILMLDAPQGHKWMRYYRGSFTYIKYRWIKSEQLPGIPDFGGELNIYENKVVMALHKPNLMGIIIESTALSNILKGMFELAWRVGAPAGKIGS